MIYSVIYIRRVIGLVCKMQLKDIMQIQSIEYFGFVLSMLYIQLVQCLLVTAGIRIVLCKGGGKVVRTRKVLFCTHIDIVVLGIIQYAFYSL